MLTGCLTIVAVALAALPVLGVSAWSVAVIHSLVSLGHAGSDGRFWILAVACLPALALVASLRTTACQAATA